MKQLVLALTAAAAFAGLPGFAHAADAQATAAVHSLLEAMDVRTAMRASFREAEKSMPEMMRAQVAGVIQSDPGLSAEQKREALAKVDKALPEVAQAMGRIFRDPGLVDELVAEMVPLYADNFTTAEIRELTAFYRTALGRKMMTAMPKLSAQSMALSQKILLPRVSRLMQDALQEAQEH